MDWIAGLFELCGMWFVGNKKSVGFILNFLGCVCWVYVAVTAPMYGLLLAVLPASIINIRNYLKWKKESNEKTIYYCRNWYKS